MRALRNAGFARLSVSLLPAVALLACGTGSDADDMNVGPLTGTTGTTLGTGAPVPTPGGGAPTVDPMLGQPGAPTATASASSVVPTPTASNAAPPTGSATGVAVATATVPSSSASAPPAAEGTATTPMEPVGPPPQTLDDFEDGDNVLLDLEGRAGHWGAYNDGTGMQMPAAGTAPVPEPGGANGSELAIHTSGSGFTDWGAGLQVDLNNTGGGAAARTPFDASAYTGLSFFVRGSGDIRVEFVTRETTEAAQGGTCAENCFDAHGSDIMTLTDEWKQVILYFDDLAQEGWGAEAAFDPASLLGLNFKAVVGDAGEATFDLWIDELSFSTAAPGTNPDGSVMPEEMEPEEDLTPVSEPGMCGADLGGYNGNGSVTMYWFDQGSAEVNCSFQITSRNPDTVAHVATGEGRYFGAMNTADYNTAAMCGACAEVTRDGSRTVTVTIVDQCPVGTNPKCQSGHIDLSRDAFYQLGNDQEGHLGTGNGGRAGSISWRYVPCPVDGNVIFKWKKGAEGDQYWDELLVQNTPYAISSVEIDGQPAVRKDYNYWEPPEGTIKASKDTYRVRVTDITGAVIEASIERPATDVDAGVKLTCE